MSELTTTTGQNQIATAAGSDSFSMIQDGAMFDRLLKLADVMASGKATIPSELRNPGDCMAIAMQAMNWKMNPFAVAQKCFFIAGKIGYEAQLVAAAINGSGAVSGAFNYDWFGPWEKVIGKFEIRQNTQKGTEYRVPGWKLKDEEGVGIRIWATLRGEDSPRELVLMLSQAQTRNSTLWAEDPRQQLAYLAQKRWARLYAPGVILGVYTPDELQDVAPPMERDITPNAPPKTATEAAQQAAAQAPQTPEELGLTPEKLAQRAALIAELEKFSANHTKQQWRKHWASVSEDDKKLIGIPHPVGMIERDRIDALAGSNVIDAEPAASKTSGPSFADALTAVQAGDFDLARDIARGLKEGQQKAIEAAITNAQGQA